MKLNFANPAVLIALCLIPAFALLVAESVLETRVRRFREVARTPENERLHSELDALLAKLRQDIAQDNVELKAGFEIQLAKFHQQLEQLHSELPIEIQMHQKALLQESRTLQEAVKNSQPHLVKAFEAKMEAVQADFDRRIEELSALTNKMSEALFKIVVPGEIVPKRHWSQDAVKEEPAHLRGPTEATPSPAASDVPTEEADSHADPTEDAIRGSVALSAEERKLALQTTEELRQESPLFSDLSPADYREIVSAAHEKHFARRQTIFLEGDPVRQIVMLTSGSAKIVQLSQNGAEVILRVKGPGEVVGTLGLSPQARHLSTAKALSPSTALVWDAAVFESIAQQSMSLRQNITYILCQQLADLEERYREISTERVSVRLSQQLGRLLKQIGRRVHGGVEIGLSREELAQLTGTTLFTVSRLLSNWSQRGIVSTRRDTVFVSDLSDLQKIISSEET